MIFSAYFISLRDIRLVNIFHGGVSLVALVIDKLVFPPVPSAKVLQQE